MFGTERIYSTSEAREPGHAEDGAPAADAAEQARHLAEAHRIVVDGVGRAFALYGVPIALGRVFALLFLADTPLTVTEIAARLALTKSTTSVNLRLLERLHLVRQVWPAHRRGKFYVAERDLERIVGELLRTTMAAELALVMAALEESESHLGRAEAGPDPAAAAQARADRTRLAALRAFYDLSTRLLEQFATAGLGSGHTGQGAPSAPDR